MSESLKNWNGGGWVRVDFARQLEMERDEARMAGVGYSQQTVDAITNEREQLRRERDEARGQIKELIYIAERAIDLAEIDFENDKFGTVSELRSDLEKIKEGAK